MTKIQTDNGVAGGEHPLAQTLHTIARAEAEGDLRRRDAAFSKLVARVRPRLRAVVHKNANHCDTEDALQDALIRILNYSSQFRGQDDRAAGSWLCMIARNAAISITRKALRRQECAEHERSRQPIQTVEPGVFVDEEKEAAARVYQLSIDSAVALVETHDPEDLYILSREKQIGSKPDAVRANISVWHQVRVERRDALEVARELFGANHQAAEASVLRNRVAKRAQRGAWGVALGARRCARDPELSDHTEMLEKLAANASAPQKRAKTKPQGDRLISRGGSDV